MPAEAIAAPSWLSIPVPPFLHIELAQAATSDTHRGHCCAERGKQESSDFPIMKAWHLETESLSAPSS
jgi:hypothetical protein